MFSAAISHNCRVVTSNSHDLMQTIPTTPTMPPALLEHIRIMLFYILHG